IFWSEASLLRRPGFDLGPLRALRQSVLVPFRRGRTAARRVRRNRGRANQARGRKHPRMTRVLELDAQSFVLLHMRERRFALPANIVAELVPLGRIYTFPHTTPRIEGVLVRRGHIVPVCDFAQVLLKDRLPARRYYLIAR